MERTFKCAYSFRDTRNYQSQQECIYMALINRYFDISFIPHKKQSLVTVPFFRILKLNNEEDMIGFKELIEQRIVSRMNDEVSHGIVQKTAMRRCENYRLVDTLHVLNDILEIKGFSFDSRLTTGKKGTLKAESIYGVYDTNNIFMFNQDDIARIGTELATYISSIESENGVCVIRMNDPTIQTIVSGHSNSSQH